MRLLLITVLVTFSLAAFSNTVIESREADGEISKISIDGDWARFDSPDGEKKEGYMLVNSRERKFYMVVPEQRTIIEFSADKNTRKKKDKQTVEVGFKEIGKGSEVAGYATRKYELTADGKKCGSSLVSKQAAKIEDIGKLLSVTGSFNPEAFMPEEMMQGYQGALDSCDMAERQLEKDDLAKLGFPMKTLDSKGKIEHEIVSIDKSAKLKSGLFDLPEGYTRTTIKQMMEGMRKEMQSQMQNLNEMMKGMSPEERAKMKQMMNQFGGGSQQ